MAYRITREQYRKAKEMNVEIKPSENKNKKLDVFKNGKKVASIGDANYGDFYVHKRDKGIEYANERRRLYHKRHKNNNNIAGQMAKKLLW